MPNILTLLILGTYDFLTAVLSAGTRNQALCFQAGGHGETDRLTLAPFTQSSTILLGHLIALAILEKPRAEDRI